MSASTGGATRQQRERVCAVHDTLSRAACADAASGTQQLPRSAALAGAELPWRCTPALCQTALAGEIEHTLATGPSSWWGPAVCARLPCWPAPLAPHRALHASAAARARAASHAPPLGPFDDSATGVTRLSLASSDGAPIAVERLAVPIRFALPPLAPLALAAAADGAPFAARCQFWDVAAARYATAGCAAVPDPRPPGHELFFVEGFTAANNAAMAMAWGIRGPMVDAGECATTLLDCSSAEDAARSVFPDPSRPFEVAAVACPPPGNATGEAPPALRVVHGARCALWRADNALGCWWDNVKQARGLQGLRCSLRCD